MPPYNIGETAARSGVSAKMIRHYETLGLIPKASRTDSGYRTFAESDVHVLQFIRRARDLGFSIRHIGELLSLWQNRRRRSDAVKALALVRIAELQARIVETQAMKATLEHLVRGCRGDDRPGCPILDDLARPDEPDGAPASRGRRRTPAPAAKDGTADAHRGAAREFARARKNASPGRPR